MNRLNEFHKIFDARLRSGPDHGDNATGPEEGDAHRVLASSGVFAVALLELLAQGPVERARWPSQAASSRIRAESEHSVGRCEGACSINSCWIAGFVMMSLISRIC